MAKNHNAVIKYHPVLIRRIFKRKKSFRLRKARLPIEQKIQMLVELQKISLRVRPNKGKNDTRRVWRI
jgi:hypothetical protein